MALTRSSPARRPVPAIPGIAGAGLARGPVGPPGPDRGRARRRQGAGGRPPALSIPALGSALCHAELRGPVGKPAGVGAVRSRKGCLHRSHQHAERSI